MLLRTCFMYIIIITLLESIYSTKCPCGYKRRYIELQRLREEQEREEQEKMKAQEACSNESPPLKQESPPLKHESPYLENCTCGFKTIKQNYTMPPSQTKAVNGSAPLSACLKCSACIAIAKRMNQTLVIAHKHAPDKKKLDCDYVVKLLRSVCNKGFENFGLYERDGLRGISEACSQSKHVPTQYDGTWTKKLQDLCNYYLDEFGEVKLYSEWMNGGYFFPKEMVNILCRNDRMFRDCMNIEDEMAGSSSNTKEEKSSPSCISFW